jgi:folate-binding protein YgfZ
MNNWHNFLEQQGATVDVANNSLLFAEMSADYPSLLQQPTLTPLVHLGVVSLQGPDTKKFIQGQVTCDVDQLSIDHHLIGARCNPKGRALTSFYLIQVNDEHLLMVMDLSLVPSSIDELSKYAAFFKVELNDSSEVYHCIGLSSKQPSNEIALLKQATFIANVNLSNNRQLVIVSKEHAESTWECLQQQYKPVGTELWKLQDIQAGIATIQQETSTLFVPQMFNLQAIDGISFKKGCYTGQEVVARMKYLGKLKRRMYRLSLPIEVVSKQKLPTPGSSCQLPEQEQNIGNVVAAAHANENTHEILAVLTEEAAKSTTLLIDEREYTKISYLSLPYEI